MRIINTLIICISFLSCNGNKKVIGKKTYANPIQPAYHNFDALKVLNKTAPVRWEWKPRVFTNNNSLYIGYISKANYLQFLNISNPADSFNFNLNKLLYKEFPLGIEIKDSSLFILYPENKYLNKYLMDFKNKDLLFVQGYKLNDLLEESSIRLNQMQYFGLFKNNIYLPFSIKKKSTNYLGDHFLKTFIFNKASIEKTGEVINTPNVYLNRKRHSKYCKLLFLNDTLAYCIFGASDQIDIFNPSTGKDINNKTFNIFSDYNNYDPGEAPDLSYLKIYELTNEANINAFLVNHYIVIIKKLKTKTLHEKPEFEYFVLNPDLSIRNLSKFNIPFDEDFIFPLKNSFIVFDKEKNGYYEFNLN